MAVLLLHDHGQRRAFLSRRCCANFKLERGCAPHWDLSTILAIPPVIAVTGLSFEARIASGQGVSTLCSGDRRQLLASLNEAVGRGCSGIVSFGMAGGLDPEAKPGCWVVATGVVTNVKRYPTDVLWSQVLRQKLSHAIQGDIAGVDAPVAAPSAKRMLRERTGAAAVDMESHVAASVAAACNVPFAVCRVIVDPAHRALPPAALLGQRRDGTLNIIGVLASVLHSPGQLPALMRTAMDARKARTALMRGRRLFGSNFSFPDPNPGRRPVSAGFVQ
ncbi:phosphorylase [Mesorhizobium sp. BAC0120]|uniref:phosphorylase n=1 Tax=Mesorhizobium sp. BAC0120 TaxID=3090670 RepID=UPI00399A48E6